jgi:LuxR family maltose regulon positive regulatory protein
LAQGIEVDYGRRLLAVVQDAESEADAPMATGVTAFGWVEPLSPRELEVLELIAQGLSNREIAARLYLALNTVKAHARSIYSKLGVNNRTQAAARARALGILPAS